MEEDLHPGRQNEVELSLSDLDGCTTSHAFVRLATPPGPHATRLDSWQNAPFNKDTEPFANAGFVG